MAASLRGQLGVKSSPLSPTSSKLTTQMLVISHMDNHYKKISKAKPAIDNALPKSMMSSQKLRDRQVRKYVDKYGSRPTSRTAYRPETALNIYDEQQWDEAEDDEARQVGDIMRSTLRVPLRTERGADSVDATAGSKSASTAGGFGTATMRPQSARATQVMQATALISRMRPMSARSTTSVASNYTHTSRSTNPMKVTYNGDVLNKHAHSFTEPTKPFTPRTLKSNRESSLKQYKYYTPPPRKSQVPNNVGPTSAPKDDNAHVKEMINPQAKPRRRSSRGGGGGDLGATETLTETMLMDMSLQSHGEQRQHSGADSVGGRVPRLDISMDTDHLHWMQEQATRAQIRVGTNGHASQRQDSTGGPADGGDTLEQTGTLGQTDTLRFTRTASSAKSFGIKSPTSHRLSQAEEEQKYVMFAHEVTQDIVSRSISSDRVLQKVFENHIERKKGELDERRLRAIITDIRRDLGVQHVEPLEKKSVQYSQDLEQTGDSVFQTQQDMGNTFASMDSTMESGTSNTYNFERTTDVLSTIHSQREEEEGEDLSATAALKQYQMSLSVKVDADEEAEDYSTPSESLDHTMTTDKGAAALGSAGVNGGVESESADDGSQYISGRAVDEEYHPSPRPRRLARQNLGATGGQKDLSRQDSDTDAKTEVEEEVEEEDYEDDYDADDDDNQEKASEDEF